MHIRIRGARNLEMHDVIDTRNVNATRCNICRQQNCMRRAAKPIEVLQSLLLLELTMQWIRGDAQQKKQWHKSAHAINCIQKHECAPLVSEQQIVQVCILVLSDTLDLGFVECIGNVALWSKFYHHRLWITEINACEQVV